MSAIEKALDKENLKALVKAVIAAPEDELRELRKKTMSDKFDYSDRNRLAYFASVFGVKGRRELIEIAYLRFPEEECEAFIEIIKARKWEHTDRFFERMLRSGEAANEAGKTFLAVRMIQEGLAEAPQDKKWYERIGECFDGLSAIGYSREYMLDDLGFADYFHEMITQPDLKYSSSWARLWSIEFIDRLVEEDDSEGASELKEAFLKLLVVTESAVTATWAAESLERLYDGGSQGGTRSINTKLATKSIAALVDEIVPSCFQAAHPSAVKWAQSLATSSVKDGSYSAATLATDLRDGIGSMKNTQCKKALGDLKVACKRDESASLEIALTACEALECDDAKAQEKALGLIKFTGELGNKKVKSQLGKVQKKLKPAARSLCKQLLSR